MDTILIVGASGQIGTEITGSLRAFYGASNVIASDLKPTEPSSEGPFEIIDVLDPDRLLEVVKKYRVTQIYNLAAVLSAKGEKDPYNAWKVNMTGLLNVLEITRQEKLNKVYWPSSIAVFGPGTPKVDTPQKTIMDPNTVYGISKLAGERWCEYYHEKYDIDVRSLRYPGIIGYKALPGGGTTDYAVDIFHYAMRGENYTCFLKEDTYLPMMYMDDAIRGTIEFMEIEEQKIKVRSSYNVAGISFSPEEIAQEIAKHFPDFTITYHPDYRQHIADSWPQSIDDSQAREDWGWKHRFNLSDMTEDMIKNISVLSKSPS